MTKHDDHAGHDDHGHDSGPLGERSELVFSLACAALTGIGWGLGRFGVEANISTGLFMVAYVLGTAHRNRGRHAAAAEALIVAHRLMPTRMDAAVMAVEEAAAAYGLDAGRACFEEVYERLPNHGLAIAWARIAFEAGLD